MQFCESCGSMMHADGNTWVCRSCDHEAPRDADAEAGMATQETQQDEGAPEVADATEDATETMAVPCPADGCESERADYEMLLKPGGSYEVRLFTCVECGHKWRES